MNFIFQSLNIFCTHPSFYRAVFALIGAGVLMSIEARAEDRPTPTHFRNEFTANKLSFAADKCASAFRQQLSVVRHDGSTVPLSQILLQPSSSLWSGQSTHSVTPKFRKQGLALGKGSTLLETLLWRLTQIENREHLAFYVLNHLGQVVAQSHIYEGDAHSVDTKDGKLLIKFLSQVLSRYKLSESFHLYSVHTHPLGLQMLNMHNFSQDDHVVNEQVFRLLSTRAEFKRWQVHFAVLYPQRSFFMRRTSRYNRLGFSAKVSE